MSDTQTSRPAGALSKTGGDLASSKGTTSIHDQVVSKIAGLATKEIAGVHAVGGGAARAIGTLRERIPGARTNHSQGVSVEVGETETAIDIDIIAEYGVAISDLSAAVRRNVIAAVERMTGLSVKEVNIDVNDIHIAGEDDDDTDDQPRARVQ
ncbi:Asp23/Gls24 family envelope stress response protein [Kineococcus gynurae]|uniref:Asp23/Gls24 family envelope stress response protein n=1 Tax=Kineococcus gynurae TaxID=452979 RepID=A0ABV5LU34_9ACTN